MKRSTDGGGLASLDSVSAFASRNARTFGMERLHDASVAQGRGTARDSASLVRLRKDPFDPELAAQALVEDLPVISADEEFDQYGVTRRW